MAFLIRLHCYDGRTTAPPLPSDDDDDSYDSYDSSYGVSYGYGDKGGTNSYEASYGGGDVASGDIDDGEGEGEGEGGGTDKSAAVGTDKSADGDVATRDRRPARMPKTGPSKLGPDLGRPARDRKRRERASKLGIGHTFQNRDRSRRGRAAAMPSAQATAASKPTQATAASKPTAALATDPLVAWFLELSLEGDRLDPNLEGTDLKLTKRRHAAGAAAAAGVAAAELVPSKLGSAELVFTSWLAPPRRLVLGFVNDPALIAALNAQPDLGWWAGTSEYMPGASLLALRRVRS